MPGSSEREPISGTESDVFTRANRSVAGRVPFLPEIAVVTIRFRDFSDLREPRSRQFPASHADFCERGFHQLRFSLWRRRSESAISAQKVRDPRKPCLGSGFPHRNSQIIAWDSFGSVAGMNINLTLKCDTCGELTNCRIGLSNRDEQPLSFCCLDCGAPIDLNLGAAVSDIKGAQQVPSTSPFDAETNFVDGSVSV
jgi:hypothetical protein